MVLSCCSLAVAQQNSAGSQQSAGSAKQNSASAQRAEFIAAAIRPSAADIPGGHDGKTEVLPDGLRMQDVTVATCIKWAYHVQGSQIDGPPPVRDEHWDIAAKTDGPVDAAQMKLMMKTLLAERFGLRYHTERREVTGYALLPAAGGVKLTPAAVEGEPVIESRGLVFVAKSAGMKEFADFLADGARSPVVDETGLTGKYDFTVDVTKFMPPDDGTVRMNDLMSVMTAALQHELGLKMVARKVMVDVMVIDHLGEPTAN